MTKMLAVCLLIAAFYGCNAPDSDEFQTDWYPPVFQKCRNCTFLEVQACSKVDDRICCEFNFANMTLMKKDSVPCEYASSNGKYCCKPQALVPTATTKRLQDETTTSPELKNVVTPPWNSIQNSKGCRRWDAPVFKITLMIIIIKCFY